MEMMIRAPPESKGTARGHHTWWANRPGERFWLEVTGRKDLGADLRAPQTNESGREFWSYSLINEVATGDVVFHYSRDSQAIIAVSIATGDQWADKIIWAARGLRARQAGIEPHLRDGWYAGLKDFVELESPLALDAIRDKTALLQAELRQLERDAGSPLYFPFEHGLQRPMRPMQGYLFKLPEFFISAFDELRLDTQPATPRSTPSLLGSTYRPADEEFCVGEADPMRVDPAIVERGNRNHAHTQNELAAYLRAKGLEPRSPSPGEPNFDLGWEKQGRIFVAEIKSITDFNEEKQLRMGLGQVLVYKHRLRGLHGREVVPVLALERKPPTEWLELCSELHVCVTWRGNYMNLTSRL